ncbi:MAG: flagellar motor protein MotD [Ectothiorhodospiraceae bacterium]|nr:flagellar motor protein MotD [Ectothiorhodospiraceae bacterium]
MARKKKPEEHVNHERWLVSYADFITLLFAFFVVMYSISSVNEGKYRVLSDSISSAFDPTSSGLPIKLNSPLKAPIISRPALSDSQTQNKLQGSSPAVNGGVEASEKDKINLKKISSRVEKKLAPLIDKKLVKIKKNDLWIEIEIKSSILFSSGVAQLQSRAVPVLRKVAEIVGDFENQVQVEGFTDNIPIDTDEFPSNWELSAARAASVVHLFSKAGVKPSRLSAVGYGQYKPSASNNTAQGRRKNRRVKIIVLSDAIARRTNRSEQLEQTISAKRKAVKQRSSQGSRSGAPPINLLPPARQTSPSGGR